MRDKKSLLKAARVLVVIGAVLMILLAMLSFLGRALSLPFYPPATMLAMAYLLLSLLAGFVALALSPKTGKFHWTLLLAAIGIVGGGLGGFLVLIGAVTALVTRIT